MLHLPFSSPIHALLSGFGLDDAHCLKIRIFNRTGRVRLELHSKRVPTCKLGICLDSSRAHPRQDLPLLQALSSNEPPSSLRGGESRARFRPKPLAIPLTRVPLPMPRMSRRSPNWVKTLRTRRSKGSIWGVLHHVMPGCSKATTMLKLDHDIDQDRTGRRYLDRKKILPNTNCSFVDAEYGTPSHHWS